jgi:hypothetical protein
MHGSGHYDIIYTSTPDLLDGGQNRTSDREDEWVSVTVYDEVHLD